MGLEIDLNNKKPKNKKIVFDNDEDDGVEVKTKKKKSKNEFNGTANGAAIPAKNKKIVFDNDEDDDVEVTHKKNSKESKNHGTVGAAPAKNKKIIFSENLEDDEEVVETTKPSKNKKIVFGDDGEAVEKKEEDVDSDEEQDSAVWRNPKANNGQEGDDEEKKWYHVYPEFPITDDIVEMKDHEQQELHNLCQSSFEAETPAFLKKNPSDAKWLLTALHKGTSKDRANAGALLIASNPLGNLQALETLIGYTKLSNKSSPEVISILTETFMDSLLPADRKLCPIQLRGADWKALKKRTDLSQGQVRKIYAYWHFENELKDHYFEFLKNLQQSIQTGQENNKNSSIIAASKLLSYSPEKEQMLLTMLINKLGDPSAKVASKALHHLSEVAYRHPNMAGVITVETEKLLFRNNISERAQHFALCFLVQIASTGQGEVCTKLVNICFSLFKVLVKKGAVNTRTMQAILRCLQKAILQAKPADGSTEIMTKDMQDTIYRLVHLADIQISIQTLSLLLQLITVKSEKSDRFYNALYKKMLDLNLTTVGNKTAALFLHIVHRAMHIDQNVARAQAFIKRLMQLALYMPSQIAAGCLIVVSKVFRMRHDLRWKEEAKTSEENGESAAIVTEDDLAKFDSDGDEKYEDVVLEEEEVGEKVEEDGNKKEKSESSWLHVKVSKEGDGKEQKVKEISASAYDPYHRAPAFAGAEFSLRTELLLLQGHFHPSVEVFANSVLNYKKIDYYGDPLRDFSLSHLLERFAFKNPKKLDNKKSEILKSVVPHVQNKNYVSYGSRGKPVKSLTKSNCTEDERFIFNFLEKKRLSQVQTKKKDDDDDDDVGDVDDDEFEAYLDGLGAKKGDDDLEDDVDFLKEIGGDFKDDGKKGKKAKKRKGEDEEGDDEAMDWSDGGEDGGSDDDGSVDLDGGEDDDDELYASDEDLDDGGSISLDENEDLSEPEDFSDDDGEEQGDSDDEDAPPKAKKSKKISEREFSSAMKHSTDMSSLFAAADDFQELLEETGKTKGQGTSSAVFNKDKSSDKQMKWEEKRRSNYKSRGGKFGKKFGGGGGGKKFGSSKRR